MLFGTAIPTSFMLVSMIFFVLFKFGIEETANLV